MAQDDPLRDVLSMLSHEQQEALRLALAKTAASRKTSLSDNQLRALKDEAGRYREAQRQAAEAIGVLWNARLDLAINTGNVEDIQRALLRPVREEFYDNCNCGGGGGTSYW